MKTPEFNKFETRKRKVWVLAGAAAVTFALTMVSVIAVSQDKGKLFEQTRKIEKYIGGGDRLTGSMILWGILLALTIVLENSAIFAGAKRDKVRREFTYIVGDYIPEGGWPDYKHAKMVAEYVLQFMTDAEKNTIAKFYKVTNFNNSKDIDVFVAKVKEIMDSVEERIPDMSKTITDIANDKTYMFCNGRGGR